MSLHDLFVKARSYRRYQEERDVSAATLIAAIDAARFVPSSANIQPMRYAVSTNRAMNAKIFPHLRWAGALPEWDGPEEGQRPAAYIILGADDAHPQHHMVDLGIASQSIFLFLAEQGLAACMFGSINAKAIHEIANFSVNIKVLQVMAVGYPDETIILEHLAAGGNSKYYRDAEGKHHVPKRMLSEVLVSRFE